MSLQDPNVVNRSRKKRVAVVIANPRHPSTGWPVGFWWSELTHPYFLLSEPDTRSTCSARMAGRARPTRSAILATRAGTRRPISHHGLHRHPAVCRAGRATRPAADIDVDAFDAILVAGGQAPMFTFDTAATLHEKFVEFYERGKIAVALCHGVAILKYARLSNGEHLAKGKTVTGFANVEEDFADNAVWDMNLLPRDKHVMPWRIEDEMKRIGANYVQAGLWRPFAIRDGNLITGQQNFSGAATAALS